MTVMSGALCMFWTHYRATFLQTLSKPRTSWKECQVAWHIRILPCLYRPFVWSLSTWITFQTQSRSVLTIIRSVHRWSVWLPGMKVKSVTWSLKPSILSCKNDPYFCQNNLKYSSSIITIRCMSKWKNCKSWVKSLITKTSSWSCII